MNFHLKLRDMSKCQLVQLIEKLILKYGEDVIELLESEK